MTPKPNPAEYTLCAWVEFAYNALTAVIDWALKYIDSIFRTTMAAINAAYFMLVEQMEKIVDTLTKIIEKCVNSLLPEFSEDDRRWLENVRNSFCEMLRRCEFVANILFERNKTSNGTWLDITNLQSIDTPPYFAELNDPYLWLERVVCNFSLHDLIAQGGELTKELLRGYMDDYIYNAEYGFGWARRQVEKIWKEYDRQIHRPLDEIIPLHLFRKTWNSTFGWIPKDMADPNKMNIFDLMRILDQITNCAFSICNFATSVLTYKEDKKTKLQIDWDAELPIPPSALSGVYKLSDEFNSMVSSWRTSAETSACVS